MDNETFLADVRKYAYQFPAKVRGSYRSYDPAPVLLSEQPCPKCGANAVHPHRWDEVYRERNDRNEPLPAKTVHKYGLACWSCWHRWEG